MLEYIAVVLNIVGLYLNVEKHWSCWVLFIIGTLILLIGAIKKKDWPLVIMFSFYEIANSYGLYMWLTE